MMHNHFKQIFKYSMTLSISPKNSINWFGIFVVLELKQNKALSEEDCSILQEKHKYLHQYKLTNWNKGNTEKYNLMTLQWTLYQIK